MKGILISLAAVAAVALMATPAAAQRGDGGFGDIGGPGYSRTDVAKSPSDIGVMATTPSRIDSSRREMNRGRTTPFEVEMSARETRRYAAELIERADIHCDIAEALVVARTPENVPVLEIDCVEGGGLMIADTVPVIQATDCLDLPQGDRRPVSGNELMACRLPANIATVAAARQSAARN